jgi:drug/metabolite transporter (DMT)-like permease
MKKNNDAPQAEKLSRIKILGIVLTGIYSLLMLFVLFNSSVSGIAMVVMIVGCALNIAYLLILKTGRFNYLIIVGMICISAGAVIIGIEQGSTQMSHHIIRAIFEGFVVTLLLTRPRANKA